MIKKNNLKLIKLTFVLLLALMLRLIFIDWVPARLTVDEMSIGYNAYSILKTGKDEWGRTLPLVFEAFGDFKLPLYIYFSVPFVALFGLTNLGIKMLSILSGVGLVWMMYLIVKTLTKNDRMGLYGALLTAIIPWAVHLSRQALESNLALFLFSVGIYFLVTFDKNRKRKYLIGAGIAFGLTFWAYIAYRLLIVLLIGVFAWWIGAASKKSTLLLLACFVITILPLSFVLFSNAGLARAKHVSIFTDPGVVASVNEDRSFCFLVSPKLVSICKVFFNKPGEVLSHVSANYLSFFSTEFLFISGDNNLYLNNPDGGELNWIFVILIILGFISLRNLSNKAKAFVVALLLLSPLPAALAGKAQMVRSSAMIVPLVIVMSLGLNYLIKKLRGQIRKRLFFYVLMIVSIFLIGQNYLSYFLIYPTKYDNAAYQIPIAVAEDLKEKVNEYDLVYVNDTFSDAHMFLAFYLKVDPRWYQENIVRPKESDGFGFSHPIKMGKFEFGPKSLDDVYCNFSGKNGAYITNQSYKGYASSEYKNFSKVHVQAKSIDFLKMDENLKLKGIEKSVYCGDVND